MALELHRSPDQILALAAIRVCEQEGLDFLDIPPAQRIFITHFRCPMCKLQPLHLLDLRQTKRARCKKCGNLVSSRNGGSKYGKIRKKVCLLLNQNNDLDGLHALTHTMSRNMWHRNNPRSCDQNRKYWVQSRRKYMQQDSRKTILFTLLTLRLWALLCMQCLIENHLR